jgi:hypothetical protein
MDVASAILALQLQIEDNEGLLAALDRREDFHTALTLHISELQERLQILQDHSMAYRPLSAVGGEIIEGNFGPYHTTSDIPSQPQALPISVEPPGIQTVPIGVRKSRRNLTGLTSQRSTQPSLLHNHEESVTGITGPMELEVLENRQRSQELPVDGLLRNELPPLIEFATKTGNLMRSPKTAISNTQRDLQPDAASSTFHNAVETPATDEAPADFSCIACLTAFPEELLIKCPCDHKYCDHCLAEHFKVSIQSLAFPPACCGQIIPLDLAEPHLNIRLLASYKTKKAAIENPGTVHCALLSCQARIAPENISNGRATCICKTVTCVMCKFTVHENACPEDTDRVALLSLAVAEGFRACYRCGELYERIHGCNHMK